jgi:hypothetical protein
MRATADASHDSYRTDIASVASVGAEKAPSFFASATEQDHTLWGKRIELGDLADTKPYMFLTISTKFCISPDEALL